MTLNIAKLHEYESEQKLSERQKQVLHSYIVGYLVAGLSTEQFDELLQQASNFLSEQRYIAKTK